MSIHPLPFVSVHESAPYKYAIQELAVHHISSESTTTIQDKIDGNSTDRLYGSLEQVFTFNCPSNCVHGAFELDR